MIAADGPTMGEALQNWQGFLLEIVVVVALTILVWHKDADVTIFVAVIGPMVGGRVATRGVRAGATASTMSMRPPAFFSYDPAVGGGPPYAPYVPPAPASPAAPPPSPPRGPMGTIP